jgi:hypothetical protein
MRRAILNISQKGGVGKSTEARVQADLGRRCGRQVDLWDLDAGTGSVALYYASEEARSGCGREDVRHRLSPGAWLESLDGDADDVVLDVPGGAVHELLRFFPRGVKSLVSRLSSANRELVVVSLIGTQRDTMGTAIDNVELFGSDAHHVVVKNGYFGEEAAFRVYEGYPDPVTGERRRGKTADRVRSVGGETVYLPKLDEIPVDMLDDYELTFLEGAEAADKLGPRYSWFVREWLIDVEERFAGSWLDVAGNVGASLAPIGPNGERKRRGQQPVASP